MNDPKGIDDEIYNKLKEKIPLLKKEIAKNVIGQEQVVNQLLITILARGHSIFVGVPGLAKTTLINTLAQVLSLNFSRIQFTPDLMPSDIMGAEVLEEDTETGRRSFRFLKGPVFANIVLADEIIRSSHKTQSDLLQSMQEYAFTVAGKTYNLEPPFLIFATQNPIEQEGTFPLPEAQLDRFMFQIAVEYQDREEEITVIKAITNGRTVDVNPVIDKEDINHFQALLLQMPVSDQVYSYAIDLVRRTRPSDSSCPDFMKKNIHWGAGPRGAQYLVLAAKGNALINGRLTVSPEDIRTVLLPVLRHRIILNFKAEAENIITDDLLLELSKRFSLCN